jgi:toxin secretion/phage lysis holin
MLLDALSAPTKLKFTLAASLVTVQSLTGAICTWMTSLHVVTGSACTTVTSASPLFYALLALNVIDMLTGMLAARSTGQRIISARFSQGIRKKMTMVLIVAMAALLDSVVNSQLGGKLPAHFLFTWSAGWYLAVEVLSVYENAVRLGVPFPPVLKQLAERLLEKKAPASSPPTTPEGGSQ